MIVVVVVVVVVVEGVCSLDGAPPDGACAGDGARGQ